MKKEKRSSRLSLKQNYFFYLMILPTLLYLLIFQIYPIIETVRISFTNWHLTDQSSGGYVGFANYTRLFTQDSNFWTLFRNSVFWVLGSTVLQYFFAIPISILLNQKMRARGLWRGLMMVPWVTPMVIAGLIWRWMFEGNYGLFNQLLGTDIVWLADSSTVWICLLIVSTWKGIPYATLMFLAGLQGIPGDLYEAAYVDGAGPFRRFWHITLPLLSPVIMVTALTSMVATWTKFETIWTMTSGGPGYTTSILPVYIYMKAFRSFEMGVGSAVAVVAMLVMTIFIIIYLKFYRKYTERL